MTDTTFDPEVAATHNQYFHTFSEGANVVLPDGQTLFFHGGRYATDNPDEIAQLDKISKQKNGYVYVKPGEEKIDPRELDPIEKIRLEAIRGYLAKQAIIQARKSGDTEYTPQSTSPASTTDMVATHAQQQAVKVAETVPAVVPATTTVKK